MKCTNHKTYDGALHHSATVGGTMDFELIELLYSCEHTPIDQTTQSHNDPEPSGAQHVE